MDWDELMKKYGPKPLATRKSLESVIKFASKLLDEPVRSIRIFRTCGQETDPEYEMKFFVWGIIIDRYEIRVQNGTYTIFDTYCW